MITFDYSLLQLCHYLS